MTEMFYNYTVMSLWLLALLVVLIIVVFIAYLLISFTMYCYVHFKTFYLSERVKYLKHKKEVDDYEKTVTKES